MRFFLLLAAVVAVVVDSGSSTDRGALAFQMPGPFVDGTIMTFFFWHTNNHEGSNHEMLVPINFYNLPTNFSWKKDGVYDIPARIAVINHNQMPVGTNTYQNGLWWKPVDDWISQERPNDFPRNNGWWRLDVIKIDRKRLNIFFQGFWSGVREFGMSLDDIQSAYIDTKYIDTRFFEISIKTANPALSPKWLNGMDGHGPVSNPLAKISTFPIGSRIDLIAMIRASGEQYSNFPSLFFGPKPVLPKVEEFDTIFFIITQTWEESKTHTLYISLYDHYKERRTECINTKPNGDLHHLQVERIRKDVIRMRVMYQENAGNIGKVTCDLTIPPSMWSHMDQPFYILSLGEAILFHIEQSIPQPLLPLPSSYPEIH